MSARAFQVGDRVRISGWVPEDPHEGTVTEIEPPDPAGRFGPYIVTDCRYTTADGRQAVACCAMTDDMTAGCGCTVELIEPVPELPQRVRGATLTGTYIDASPAPVSVVEYSCPVAGCDYYVGAAGPIDPDEPDYLAEDVDEHIRSHEPGTDLIVRPFQVGDTVENGLLRGTIYSMVDHFMFGQCVVFVTMAVAGYSFPTWDGFYLTADRTRPTADSHQTIVWVDEPDSEPDGDEFLQAMVDGVDDVERERLVVDTFAPPADAPRAWEGWVPPIELLPEWMYGGDPHGSGVFAVRRDEADLERPVLQNSMAGLMSIAKVA